MLRTLALVAAGLQLLLGSAAGGLVLPLEDLSPLRPGAQSNDDDLPQVQGPRFPVATFQDAIHTITVQLGSQGSAHRLLLDTGSSDLWVWQPGTAGLPAWPQTFDSTASTSWTNTTIACPSWGKSYRLGHVEGLLGRDRVQLGTSSNAPSVGQQVIGLPCQFTDDGGLLNEQRPFDGVWGLGFRGQSEANRLLPGGAPTLLDQLYTQNQLDAKRFSFRLARTSQESSQFVLGKEPSSWQPKQGLAWTEILPTAWLQVSVQTVFVGDKDSQACGLGSCAALFSSSAPGLYFPAASWPDVRALIMGRATADGSCSEAAGVIHCSREGLGHLQSLTFTVLDAGQYSFSPKEYVFQETNPEDPSKPFLVTAMLTPSTWGSHSNMMILGDLWLRKFYTVFDIENSRVGLPKPQSSSSVSGSEVGVALAVIGGILAACFGSVFLKHKYFPSVEDGYGNPVAGAGAPPAAFGGDVEGRGGRVGGGGNVLGGGGADRDNLPPYLRQ